MRCLLMLLAILLFCAWLAPSTTKLHGLALQALDSSLMCGPGGDDPDAERTDDEEKAVAPLPPRPPPPRQRREVGIRGSTESTAKRRRVTPFQAKLVAAAQDWRCGCGCRDPEDARGRGCQLDANFEIDHRIPTRWGGKHDKSNWVAVLRSHHAIKSARESSISARRGR